jgi:hypothetical protein
MVRTLFLRKYAAISSSVWYLVSEFQFFFCSESASFVRKG